MFFIIFSAIQVEANQADSILNHQAKPVEFQQSLDIVKRDFYHNKILVLDFWATWCAPCIAGFPHFNELSKKYSSSGVVFASITTEPLSIVQRFFTRTAKELYAIKLIDTTKTTMNAYKAFSIPYCVIIDKTNMVRWVGNTNDLTEKIIDEIVHPNQIYAKPDPILQVVKPINKPTGSHAFFSFNAARSDTGKFSLESGESHRTYFGNIVQLSSQNNSLADIVELITGYSKSRFVTNSDLKIKQHIDLEYKIGSDTSRFRSFSNSVLKNAPTNNFIINLLGEAFKFNAKIIRKKQKHYELIIADTAKLHSFISMQSKHSSFSDDDFPRFEITNHSVRDITTHLESSTKAIITTNINDNNQYDLSLDISSIETLKKGLQFHGLKLIEVNDEVELLDIDFY